MLLLTPVNDTHTMQLRQPSDQIPDTPFPPSWGKGHVWALHVFARTGQAAQVGARRWVNNRVESEAGVSWVGRG